MRHPIKKQLSLYISTISIILCMGINTACSLLHHPEQPFNQKINWSRRKNQLSQMKYWQIQGAMSAQTAKQTAHISFNWQQLDSQHYKINLFGPLGIGSIIVYGQPDKVILKTSKQQSFCAKTPKKLLEQQLGWHLPISNLTYWIRGVPVPNHAYTKQLDQYDHLIKLFQQNWEIDYLQYTAVKNMDLPQKIALKNPELNLRIVIYQWTMD